MKPRVGRNSRHMSQLWDVLGDAGTTGVLPDVTARIECTGRQTFSRTSLFCTNGPVKSNLPPVVEMRVICAGNWLYRLLGVR